MGEWTEYFEDFPEEDPALQDACKPNPLGIAATAVKQQQAQHGQREVDEVKALLDKAIKKKS